MALPTSGIKLGEVRIDPADGLEYRCVDVFPGFFMKVWVRNTPEVLEPLASSSSFPSGSSVGEVRVDSNTGVSFRWNGSAWVLISNIVEVADGAVTTEKLAASSVTSGKIADESIVADDISGTVFKVHEGLVPSASVINMNAIPVNVSLPVTEGHKAVIESVVLCMTGGTTGYNYNFPFDWIAIVNSLAEVTVNVASEGLNTSGNNVFVYAIAFKHYGDTAFTFQASGAPTVGDRDMWYQIKYREVPNLV